MFFRYYAFNSYVPFALLVSRQQESRSIGIRRRESSGRNGRKRWGRENNVIGFVHIDAHIRVVAIGDDTGVGGEMNGFWVSGWFSGGDCGGARRRRKAWHRRGRNDGYRSGVSLPSRSEEKRGNNDTIFQINVATSAN